MTSIEFRKKISTSFMVALFFVSTLLLFGPYRTFLNNITEFHVPFLRISWCFIAAAVLIFIALSGMMVWSIKRPFHQKIVSFLFIISVLFWLYGNIINGVNSLVNEKPVYEILELLIWIAIILSSLYFSSFFYRVARLFSILLILTQVVCLGYEIIHLPDVSQWMDKYLDTDSPSFHRFSNDKNIVILILDGFPSFIFQEIIEEDPSYKKIFDGFTYYRNSLSGYPNTRASIPNILTGEFYKNSEPFPEFIKKVYQNKSLPRILSRNGYQSDGLESNGFMCDFSVFSNYVSRDKSQGFWQVDALAEFSMLSRITLFRSLPLFIKKHFGLASLNNGMFIGTDALSRANSIAKRFYVDNGRPVFKYYHLSSPHPPILFNEKLEYENLDVNRENFVRYAKGSLNIAKMLIDKLIESNIYDDTLILLISDHGCGWPIKKDGKFEALNVDVRALPLILIKPFGVRSDLKVSDAPVHLQDIPATVISALNLKENMPGVSIFSLKDSDSRKRFYLQYTSIDDAQKIMYMEPLKEYIVSGFSWSDESWQASGKTFKPGYNYSENHRDLTITADKSNINSPPEFVDRSNPTLFWEAPGGYPYWLKFEFVSNPKKINKYSLKTGIHDGATEEMPKEWQFQGSTDGVNWVTLDVRAGEIKWKKNEERIYNVKNKESYNYHRLYFEQGNRLDYIRIYEISLRE